MIYYTLLGVPYIPVLDPVRGVVLRKAARKRVPSPGQMSLFAGNEPKQGDTKVESGVTYRLNQHSRWERVDKAKGKKVRPKAVVPVVEEKQEEAKPAAIVPVAEDRKTEPDKIVSTAKDEFTKAESASPLSYKELIQRAEQRFAKEIGILEDINEQENKRKRNMLNVKIASRSNLLDEEMHKLWNNDPSYSYSRERQLLNEIEELTQELRELNPIHKLSAMESIRRKLISKKNDANTLSILDKIDIQPNLPGEPDVNYREILQELISATNGKVNQLEQVVYFEDRACADFDGKRINTGKAVNESKEQERSFWHEYGHLLENADPELKDAAVEWILSRWNGKPITQLKKLIPGSDYEDGEAAWPGRFISPYVGKYYGSYTIDYDGEYVVTDSKNPLKLLQHATDKDVKANVKATEVYAIGLQHFWQPSDMLRLYNLDKEYFLLTLGALS